MIKRHILHEEVQRERKDEVLEFLICRSKVDSNLICRSKAESNLICRSQIKNLKEVEINEM
jgi:hypothetical protein